MYTIHHDIEILASKEDIFQMVGTSEGLQQWWTEKSEGEAKLGEEIRLYFSDEFDWKAKIIQISINQSFVMQMIKSDRDWDGTILAFELLEQSPDKQILRFEHRNWSEVNDHFRRTSFCWALYFNDLKQKLESKSH